MLEFTPTFINSDNIGVICINCNFSSPIFLTECPECKCSLEPAELKRYFIFKKIYQDLYEDHTLSPALIMEIGDRDQVDLKNDRFLGFICLYFQNYYLTYFYESFSKFYQNFEILLKADYLYEYRALLIEEMSYIYKKAVYHKEETEKLSNIFGLAETYKYIDIVNRAKDLLITFSQKNLIKPELSAQDRLISSLVFKSLNELISKIKREFRHELKEDFDSIVEFKMFLSKFSEEKDSMFKKFPRLYLELIDYKNFYKILNEGFVDLFFLPKHDVYMVVKKEYTPDIEAIQRILETGGINVNRLVEHLNISSLEAEIIIQVLMTRQMAIEDGSYRTGELIYLRGPLGGRNEK